MYCDVCEQVIHGKRVIVQLHRLYFYHLECFREDGEEAVRPQYAVCSFCHKLINTYKEKAHRKGGAIYCDGICNRMMTVLDGV